MNYTKCYLSVPGHNNFLYPSESTALLTQNCEYNILPWLGGQQKKLTPIRVKKMCVVPLDMSKPGSAKGYTVVWVETSLLPLSSAG